jgi:hypothetical protein
LNARPEAGTGVHQRDQDASTERDHDFRRYHLVAKLSEAIDAVRRQEVATRPELTHTRWLWLKYHANLSATQQGQLHQFDAPRSPAGHCPGPVQARARLKTAKR